MIEEKRYMEIDIDSLATVLAENDWGLQTQMKPKEELYEVVGDTEVWNKELGKFEAEKQIKPEWARKFFYLRQQYEDLILSYKKKK